MGELTPKKKVKAIGLLSGGLDSTLAAKVLKDQGIEVKGVTFSTGFCVTDWKRAVPKPGTDPKKLRNEALRAGADLEIPVEVIDISAEYMKILTAPKYGYGKNINPCIDCRAFMLTKAREIMEREGADFVFTGEVLGQRPMSQRRDALRIVEKESGLTGKLLRPLSAKILPETPMEKEGLVQREELLSIQGRSRTTQLRLINEAGFTDVPTPAGGCCFLADETFARKYKDLVGHRTEVVAQEEIVLLKCGRHLRISPTLKAILGRHESENEFLERYREGRTWLVAESYGSSLCLADGVPTGEEKILLARLVARYSQGKEQPEVAVRCVEKGVEEILNVPPLPLEEIERFRI